MLSIGDNNINQYCQARLDKQSEELAKKVPNIDKTKCINQVLKNLIVKVVEIIKKYTKNLKYFFVP